MRNNLDIEAELNSRNYRLKFRQAFNEEGLTPYQWFKQHLGTENPPLTYGELTLAEQRFLDRVRTKYKAVWRKSKGFPMVRWSTRSSHPIAVECLIYLEHLSGLTRVERKMLEGWSR